MAQPVKSTARLWPQAPGPAQKYRDRQRITLPSGEKRDLVGYGPTKRAATVDLQAKVTRAVAMATTGDTITVRQLFARLLRHKRDVRGRKRRTIWNDLDLFKRHVDPYIGHEALADVTLAELQAIQTRLVAGKKYRTAELATIQLRSVFKFAMREYRSEIRAGAVRLFNVAEDLDAVQRPAGSRRKTADAWTVEQLHDFLTAARGMYDRSVSNLLYPVFHTAIAAGLRLGELMGLRQPDLQVTETPEGVVFALAVERQLSYYGGKHHEGTPKTEAGARVVPIGPELAEVLLAHREKLKRCAARNPQWERNDLMFPSYWGRPLQPRHLYRARANILEAKNLPHVTLHELRSLYATYVTRELVRQGRYSPKLVMELLGHSHPNVALLHYTRVVAEDLAAATFNPLFGASLDKSLDNVDKEKDAGTVVPAS